jgi:hypothetical protein
MATETRPGFRLPWAAGTGEAEDPTVMGDPSVAEEAQEPDMIETTAMPEPNARSLPPVEPETGTPPARRATKFMADLSRAMQAAAETARGETMARFEVEAKGVVEAIHSAATDEAADLRRRADDDVAAIRDWSKTEIARIREETETRIAARKGGLDGEMEQHAATVEARVERVKAVVAAFETQMSAFFERLNAEEDPTRIATMAETMPDPPSLADVAASVAASAPTPPVAPVEEPSVDLFGVSHAESAESAGSADATELESPVAFDFAAAEAEVASLTDELDADDDLSEPAADAGDADAGGATATSLDLDPVDSAELATSKVVVTGLVSVANIANFKRSLARTPGVSSIAVASGPDGDFVFTVGHTLGTGLTASVQGLAGFDIEITGETDEAINVAAQDRDATD